MATCRSCGATTAEGARFCPTCGADLSSACSTCGTVLPPGASFCPNCGAAVAPASRAGEERRLVTIVFADVTGSTELGERLDPERFREVMQAYAQAMREEIEAEGGTVEKFIGDAVMAVFGVPAAHEDDPARALRAGRRMLGRLRRVNDGLRGADGVELQIRIGVNTGEVLATLDPAPGEAMVTGDAVNAAARLEAAAAPGQIVVAERTAASVRGFLFEDLGSLDLKGKARPVRAYALVDAVSDAPERGVPGLHAPMIGRDDELGLLRAVFERVLGESRPSIATIYGDAGLGKSRLTAEFLSWAERTEAAPLVLRGRCLPYGDGITYWPLAEILKGHAGILDSDPTDIAVDKVRKLSRDLFTPDVAPDPGRSAAALAYTIGLEDPEVVVPGARSQGRARRGARGLADLLLGAGPGRARHRRDRRHPLGRPGAARPARRAVVARRRADPAGVPLAARSSRRSDRRGAAGGATRPPWCSTRSAPTSPSCWCDRC